MKRTGKIARLPRPLREELNQRLHNGEPGVDLIRWLNRLPEVQAILNEHFHGAPIKPQNLSAWNTGGYLDWLTIQELIATARAFAAATGQLAALEAELAICLPPELYSPISGNLDPRPAFNVNPANSR